MPKGVGYVAQLGSDKNHGSTERPVGLCVQHHAFNCPGGVPKARLVGEDAVEFSVLSGPGTPPGCGNDKADQRKGPHRFGLRAVRSLPQYWPTVASGPGCGSVDTPGSTLTLRPV